MHFAQIFEFIWHWHWWTLHLIRNKCRTKLERKNINYNSLRYKSYELVSSSSEICSIYSRMMVKADNILVKQASIDNFPPANSGWRSVEMNDVMKYLSLKVKIGPEWLYGMIILIELNRNVSSSSLHSRKLSWR